MLIGCIYNFFGIKLIAQSLHHGHTSVDRISANFQYFLISFEIYTLWIKGVLMIPVSVQSELSLIFDAGSKFHIVKTLFFRFLDQFCELDPEFFADVFVFSLRSF